MNRARKLSDREILDEAKARGWIVEIARPKLIIPATETVPINELTSDMFAVLLEKEYDVKIPFGCARKFIGVLLKKYPHLAPYELIYSSMYEDRSDGGPDNAITIMRETVSLLRKRLKQTPYQIVNVWDEGYKLNVSFSSS